MKTSFAEVLTKYDVPPVLSWPASDVARCYVVEFSMNEFMEVVFTSSEHIPELTSHAYSIPDWAWQKAPWFRVIYWRVLAVTEYGKTELCSGTLRRITGKRILLLLANILGRTSGHGGRGTAGKHRIHGDVVQPRHAPTGRPHVNSLEELPCQPEFARGYFANVFLWDERLHAGGWMLLPERKIDGIDVFIDGNYATTVPVLIHEELPDEFSFIPHAAHSLFHFSVDREWQSPDQPMDLCLVGFSKGKPVCRMETTYCPEWEKMVVLPPGHLMKRIANNEDAHYYRTSAMKSYWDYFRLAGRFLSFETVEKVLDWGCGVGRILGLASQIHPEWKFHGCDVDREAISWCQSNITPYSMWCLWYRRPNIRTTRSPWSLRTPY